MHRKGIFYLAVAALFAAFLLGCELRVEREGSSSGNSSNGSGAFGDLSNDPPYEQLTTYEKHERDILANACVDDLDCDDLRDEEELLVARTFAPIYLFDEQEHDILTKNTIQEFFNLVFLYQVANAPCGFVSESGSYSRGDRIVFTITATYTYDYVPIDGISNFGFEEDTFAHYGDTERIQFCLKRNGQSIDTSYNINDIVYVKINRHGDAQTYSVSDFQSQSSHIYVHISEGKHAAFRSDSECENGVGYDWVFWDEDCSGLGDAIQIYPTIYENLNVGSSHTPLIESSSDVERLDIMFPNSESVWEDVKFCGGYFVTSRNADRDVYGPYSGPVCAGSLSGKWVK